MSPVWKKYKEIGIIATDQELLQMMEELINAINILTNIDKSYYNLVINDLTNKWYELTLIAHARSIKEFPSFIVKT